MSQSPKMYLIYIDESYDTSHFAYAALMVPAFEWNKLFDDILAWRHEWFTKHAIPLDYELHATNFVGGRGEPHEKRDKDFRAKRFAEMFDMVDGLVGVTVYADYTTNKKQHLDMFEQMLLAIHTQLVNENAFAVLVCDEGNEGSLISLVRRMQKAGVPIDRIIEDPLFKTSKSSYFLQIADFIAFGVLRQKNPASATRKEVASAIERIKKQVSFYRAFSSEPPASLNCSK